jgi:predicted house-cleaning NTP pyrophosphatase (Maf/HAM1 superfamily)
MMTSLLCGSAAASRDPILQQLQLSQKVSNNAHGFDYRSSEINERPTQTAAHLQPI